MPPKQRITREMILEKSFVMFCEEGMGAVNARSVAKALECSTQPIFSYYAGMEDLKKTLEERAKDAFVEAISRVDTQGCLLMNTSLSYVGFAVDQPKLFAHLFLRPKMGLDYPQPATYDRIEDIVVDEMNRHGIDAEKARQICLDFSIHAHGIAALHAVGSHEYNHEMVRKDLARIYELMHK